MGKKILVLCPSPFNTAPTQRLKYEQYFDQFNKAGYDMVISSFQTQRFWKIVYKPGRTIEKVFWTGIGYLKRLFDLVRIPFFSGIYISLWVTPLGFPLFEWLTTALNNRVIYDMDDMLVLSSNAEKPRLIDRIKGTKKPLTLIKRSKFVIVCTPKLENMALAHNPNVVDISSTFNTGRFLPVEHYPKKECVVVGWTGTHSTLQYLDLLEDVLKKVAKKRVIKLLIISNKAHHIEGVETEWLPWNSETEVNDLHKMDIGIYPVKQDKWSLGKSGLKALTYMSVGLPAIATAWGATYRIIDHEKNGFLVNTEKEWIDALLKLIDSEKLREKIGKAGRAKVVEQFSVVANLSKYLRAFEETY